MDNYDMAVLIFCVALFACIIGKICGMGGGVIIKPALDALGLYSVSTINVLSGCTVIGMSLWSVGKGMVRHDSQIDLKISTPLAIGAAIGGILGKELFAAVAACFADANTAGGVQASLLLTATFFTLLYTINKGRIPSHQVRSPLLCVLIGLGLGLFGSFLGIGGGPFNIAVLFFFFTMTTKTAAQNSLYIILISQTAGMVKTLLSGTLPDIPLQILIGMVLFGVLGSEIGGRLNRVLSEKRTTTLFEGAMVLVMCINVYNILRFFRVL